MILLTQFLISSFTMSIIKYNKPQVEKLFGLLNQTQFHVYFIVKSNLYGYFELNSEYFANICNEFLGL